VLRLTLLTSAIASGTFAATLAFAPGVINVGNLVGFGEATISRAGSAPLATPKGRDCRTALDKVIAALQHAECS